MAQLDNFTFDHVPILCFWIRLVLLLPTAISCVPEFNKGISNLRNRPVQ